MLSVLADSMIDGYVKCFIPVMTVSMAVRVCEP